MAKGTAGRRAARLERYGARDGMKRCSKCETVKPIGEFFRNKGKPDGVMSRCKTCSMTAERERRQADPVRFRERRQARYAADAERYREERREHYWRDPEATRAANRASDAKRRDQKREYDRTRLRPARSAWRTPERNRALQARRRARKLAAPQGDPVLRREYEGIILRDPCVYCGKPAEHADHIQPLVTGGWDAWFNLAPACSSCNSRKHTRDLLTFLMVREQPSRRELRRAQAAAPG